MNTKKKRFAPKKRLIKHFLSLTLAGSLLLPGLVLIRSETVEANILADMAGGVVGKLRYNATVAEIIVTLLTGSGASVTNTNYLNQLNSSYGINSTLATATGTDGTIGAMMDAGLFSIADDGTFIDNGLLSAIESQPAYTNCNIDSIFGTWADGGETLTATASENIGSSLGAAAAVGTVCQVAGAFMAGMSLGNLANNFIDRYYKSMASGVDMNSDALSKSQATGATRITTQNYVSGSYVEYLYGYYTNKVLPYTCVVNGIRQFHLCNFDTNNQSWTRLFGKRTNNMSSSTEYLGGKNDSIVTAFNLSESGNWRYSGWIEADPTVIDNLKQNNNTVPYEYMPYSPDVIGRNGNQKASDFSDPSNPQSWPDMGDHLPEGEGLNVIPWSDYMDFVNDANINTNLGDTTINQGDLYNNFIENYYVTPEELPDVVSPDYTPTVPNQPTANVKPENTPQENQQNTDYMTTPGLKDVFPFSIPWDIAGLFGVFSTNNREAPVITFPIVSELFGIDEEVTIDLSPYDDVASLLRLLELIAFGLGLAFVTRYLIGAGG